MILLSHGKLLPLAIGLIADLDGSNRAVPLPDLPASVNALPHINAGAAALAGVCLISNERGQPLTLLISKEINIICQSCAQRLLLR